MGRIRTVKPEFFTSADVCSLSPLARLLYIATWCEADREGRLVWSPRTLKIRYLPEDDCNVDDLADELTTRGLVRVYLVEGKPFACIPTFLQHQHINPREAASRIPAPSEIDACPTRDDASATRADACPTRSLRVDDFAPNPSTRREEGKGKEGKGIDPPVVPQGGLNGLVIVPDDAEEQDATGPLLQLAALQQAEKPKREPKSRKPCPEVEAVRETVLALVGIDYPPAAWDGLRALIAKGTSGEDALDYVRWCATQPWERDTVRLDPTVLFRHARFAAGLAKARAKAPLSLIDDSPYSKGWT